ncbi:MAG: VWA domain-containing protein [Burkholderiaceae bacterium]
MPALLAENVVHFVRVLRAAGLPVGPERTLTALRALTLVGVERRDDVHAALGSVLIDQREHQPLFDAAFDAFWQDPRTLDRMLAALLPRIEGRGRAPKPRSARLDEALAGSRRPPAQRDAGQPQQDERIDLEAVMTWSERERLAERDFDSMSKDEFVRARRLVERMSLPLPPITTRRFEAAARGRTDLRAALRRMARDPYLAAPPLRRRRQRPPPLVVLCDVSGSMERYSRMLLHYAHALMRRHRRMHVFTFGTRLTDITRQLRFRDVDAAMAAAARIVSDWNGGTRIGESLARFNRLWARRVLTGSATVLLITDGLDREDDGRLAREAARLARYTRELVWLNPLLRFDGFEPKAAGIRALRPHVDRFLPVHNLNSLEQLAAALARPLPRRPRGASPKENDPWR